MKFAVCNAGAGIDVRALDVAGISLVVGIVAILWPRAGSAAPVSNKTPSTPTPAATDTRPRGIRNNNPLNIEDTGIAWRGLIGNDGRYARFDTALNGIRAGAINLHTYMMVHNRRTVRAIISRWAPNTENNTEAYIASVALSMGVQDSAPLIYSRDIAALLRAMIRHENGQQPYSSDLIQQAITAAGRE